MAIYQRVPPERRAERILTSQVVRRRPVNLVGEVLKFLSNKEWRMVPFNQIHAHVGQKGATRHGDEGTTESPFVQAVRAADCPG